MRTHASACPAARPSSRSSPRQRPAGPAATVAHGLVGLVLANQTSAATAATLDQHLRSAAVTASPTTARYSQKPARRDRFAFALWDSTRRDFIPHDLGTAWELQPWATRKRLKKDIIYIGSQDGGALDNMNLEVRKMVGSGGDATDDQQRGRGQVHAAKTDEQRGR